MDRQQFETVDPLLDEMSGAITDLCAGEELAGVKTLLLKISTRLGGSEVAMEINLTVFDEHRENALPLLKLGLASRQGNPAHPICSDSSPQRYTVEGGMVIVPHDRCPRCWATWNMKHDITACDECEARMGHEVLLLLDSDLCPHCEKGTLSAADPLCSSCGFEIEPSHVAWG